jgi:prepilin-type processing-associated H-X9-DG protein
MMNLPNARQRTSTTFEYFEHAGGSQRPHQHMVSGLEPASNPENWFTPSNISAGTVLPSVRRYIAYARHIGGTANYLFLDGHVESISATVIEDWVTQGYNFAEPGNAILPR